MHLVSILVSVKYEGFSRNQQLRKILEYIFRKKTEKWKRAEHWLYFYVWERKYRKNNYRGRYHVIM